MQAHDADVLVQDICQLAGPAGELAAAADSLRRLTRAIDYRSRKGEQERFEQAQAPLLEISHLIDALTRATLLAAGFHQHDRGQLGWLKCRWHRATVQQSPID